MCYIMEMYYVALLGNASQNVFMKIGSSGYQHIFYNYVVAVRF